MPRHTKAPTTKFQAAIEASLERATGEPEWMREGKAASIKRANERIREAERLVEEFISRNGKSNFR